jgi:Arc/MetJ-type ribon-helix-helix transcriptional regulator
MSLHELGGENIAAMGRPTDNPKDTLIQVRMDKETVDLMDGCVMKLNTNRSDVVRTGIKRLADDVMAGRYPELEESETEE